MNGTSIMKIPHEVIVDSVNLSTLVLPLMKIIKVDLGGLLAKVREAI